jgi:hypothetical protein
VSSIDPDGSRIDGACAAIAEPKLKVLSTLGTERAICEAAVAGAASEIETVAAADEGSAARAPHETDGPARHRMVARTKTALIEAILTFR